MPEEMAEQRVPGSHRHVDRIKTSAGWMLTIDRVRLPAVWIVHDVRGHLHIGQSGPRRECRQHPERAVYPFVPKWEGRGVPGKRRRSEAQHDDNKNDASRRCELQSILQGRQSVLMSVLVRVH